MSQSIQQSVIVKKVVGEYAWVSYADDSSSSDGCGSCSSKNACGSANLLKPLIDAKSQEKYLKVRNTLNADVGDKVTLELCSKNLLKSTLLAYLLPLFSLFLFALLGRFLLGETASALLGITGLFIGLFFVRFIASNTSFKHLIEPVMVSHNKDNSHIMQPY